MLEGRLAQHDRRRPEDEGGVDGSTLQGDVRSDLELRAHRFQLDAVTP
jgi:hypothetical protein